MNSRDVSNQKCYSFFKVKLVSVIAALTLVSCLTKVHPPPRTGTVAVTINNIFVNCHNPSNGSNSKPLTYSLSFTVFYYTGTSITGSSTGKMSLQPINITSSATNPSSTVTFNAQIPNDGTTWSIDCVIKATQCSTCALTQFGSSDICNQYQTIRNGVSGTSAAQPIIEFTTNLAVSTSTNLPNALVYDVASGFFVENVAGSCGCVVPYQ
jgi:hypothetical protein